MDISATAMIIVLLVAMAAGLEITWALGLSCVVAVLLALYFIAGFSFERPKVRRTTFFSLMGVYFSIVTLADVHDLAFTLLYAFAFLYLLANTIVLLTNVRRNPPAPQPDSETEREVLPDEP